MARAAVGERSSTTLSGTSQTSSTAPSQAVGGPIPVGINAELRTLSGSDLWAAADSLHAAGIRWIREDFTWNTIQQHPGQYSWAATDAWMSVAATEDLNVIAIPDAAPSWIAPSWNMGPTTPQADDAYGQFVRALLQRYGSNGSFWAENTSLPKVPIQYVDIWNEPYNPAFWSNGIDPAAYAQLFKTAVLDARPADPNAKFMLEGDTASWAPGDPPWLKALFAAVPDLASYADVVSVHPYASYRRGPGYCTPERGNWHATRYQVCRIFDIRRILDAHGGANVKIWITELGWSTAPDSVDAVSEATQAAYVRQTFQLLRTSWRGLVSGLIWYRYETSELNPSSKGDYYGLVHAKGTPKPAWNALVAELRRGT